MRAWLDARRVDPRLLDQDDIRVDLACGPSRHNRWRGWYPVSIRAATLRRWCDNTDYDR